jgi:hypothetical protein
MAQQYCRVNYVNPVELQKELSDLRSQKKYDEILELLNEKRQSGSILNICYYHQVACYLSLKGDTVTPFLFIDSSLRLNSFPEDILSEIDFTNLQKTQQWKILTDTLIQIYLRRHPDISNKDLSVKLWFTGINDQKMRTLSPNHYKDKIEIGSKEWKEKEKMLQKEIKNNADFMVKWVKKHHWFYYSEVGKEASDAATLFTTHLGSKKYMRKILPAVKRAVDIKEVDPYWYSIAYDRYCSDCGKKQVYGTNVCRHPVSGTAKTGFVWSELEICTPIEDEKNVDVRRAAIGLEPLKDYLKRMGMDYEYNPDNENQTLSTKKKK